MREQRATEVVDRPERSRFELMLDGEMVGYASYRDSERGVLFPHTEIAPQHRGQGLSDILIRGALDEMRRRGEAVVPLCWAVGEFIQANPQYADLLAGR